MKMIFVALLTLTAFNTGLIWFIQMVHYPGFSKVGPDAYQLYQEFHMRTISYIVAPSMLAELTLSSALLLYFKTLGNAPVYLISLALLAIIWINTAFWAVPAHNKLLNDGLNIQLIQKLVRINWWRTISWTLRSLLLAWMLVKL